MMYLRHVGLHPALHDLSFRRLGDLTRLTFDSRGIKDLIGGNEPGRAENACIKCESRGWSAIDVVKGRHSSGRKDGSFYRISGKIMYPDVWTCLDLSERQLREACAKLNDRSLLSGEKCAP